MRNIDNNSNNNIMKKVKIINNIKEQYPHLSRKDINRIIDITFDSIIDGCTHGKSYTQNNFGKFESKIRAKRKGRNIETGEIIDIPEANTIKFTISKTLFKRINDENNKPK
jgi:integration host factor subunit beta